MALAANAAAAAQQGTSGLPQFDLGLWPGQMVWLVIVFGILVFLFTKVFTPRVGGTIEAREEKISGDIGDARRLRDEAEAQSKAAAQELAQARAQAHKLAADAKAAVAGDAARRQAAEEARLAEVLSAAEGRIGVARAEAMGHVRGIAADAAGAIIERLTGASAAAADIERALAGAN
ncbi:MAG: hypothetical protein ACREEW_16930 [Caulobacteraceae bacterium]